jgi:hypothetical protein
MTTVALGSAQPAAGQVFSPPCFESGGGRIVAANGDQATFGGSGSNVGTPDTGHQIYVDHGPATQLRFASITTVFVLCDPDGRHAEIVGTGRVDTTEAPEQIVQYRIEVFDRQTTDFYRITFGAYDSGLQPVIGNINVHAR